MALLAMVAWFTQRHGWDGARVLSTLPVLAALPAVLFGPLAGVLVDRWDRRTVMVVADSARTLLVLCVPLLALATGSLALVYALAFFVFLFGVLFQAARLASIPNLVGADRVLGANSVMNVAGRVATVLGVLGGGLIVDWPGWSRVGIHPPWAAGFYIDALTYAVSVVALLVVYRSIAPQERTPRPLSLVPRPLRLFRHASFGFRVSLAPRPSPPVPRPSSPDSIGSAIARRTGHVVADLHEALVVVPQTPAVLFVYCSALLLVLVGAAAVVLYVPIIQGTAAGGLGLGTRGVGFVAGIGAVGLLLSTAVYGVVRGVPRHRVMLACFIAIGLAVIGLAFARRFEHVAALAFIAGLGISPLYIGMDTLLHQAVPDEVRGRIFAAREWLTHVALALFALGLGQATRLLPGRVLLAAVGVVTVAAAAYGSFATRGRDIG
ncbi:MAG: MFS transporter [bacterium]